MAKLYVLSLVFLFIARLRFPPNKSIAEVITSRYGRPALQLIRKFENVDFKCRKLALDLEFLNNCLQHELSPVFVQFKVANQGLRQSKVYKDCQTRLVKQEIHEKKSKLRTMTKKYNILKDGIRQQISIFDFAHVSNCFLQRNDKILNKVRLTQEKKLYRLGLVSAHETNDPEKVIFNFSSRTLSPSEKKLLVKGLNLSIPPKKLNFVDILTPFELLYKEILNSSDQLNENDILDPLAASLKNTAYDCLHSYDAKSQQNLPCDEAEALKSLLKDDNIVIQKSDKGNSVVILNKVDYVDRMKELLAETSKFRKLNIDSDKDYNFIHNQELRITRELRNLRDKGVLNDTDYANLTPTGSRPSILYGLSKVHKPLVDGMPKLRPILSAINTPTYKLSQFLVKVLKPFTTNQYTTKDSFSFAEDIRKQSSTAYMSSLDVDSLFTNIPLDETIDICVELLFKDNDIAHGLNKSEFRTLLSLATKESFILFDGNYYQQIDGVAMGSPLGPTLANIFLCKHEQNWLSDCPIEFKPIYYKRYVDDIFLLFNSPDHLVMFKSYMNSQHRCMNFTSEMEYNNSLPFLDVNVMRDKHTFITSIYRKPTFSGVYTNYDSFLPSMYKLNLISTLMFRAYTICSSWTLIHVEIQQLKSIMLRNAYPVDKIDKVIKYFLTHICNTKEKVTNHPKKQFQIILPYLGMVSGKVEMNIKSTFKKLLPSYNVQVISRAATRLNTLFNFKDGVPKYLVSGVVYKFECGRCKSTYIGETTRHTKTRFCEHMGISALTGKTLKGQNTTAVRDHVKACKCDVTFDNFSILCKDSTNEKHLQIKESLFIQRDKPNLNRQISSVPLVLFNN